MIVLEVQRQNSVVGNGSEVDFGNVDTRASSVRYAFLFRNTGDENLVVTGIALTGSNTFRWAIPPVIINESPFGTVTLRIPAQNQVGAFAPFRIAPGQSETVVLFFVPDPTLGVKTATFTFTSNAGAFTLNLRGEHVTASIEIQGNGVVIPPGAAAPNAADLTHYGDAMVRSNVVHEYQVLNTGQGPLGITGVEIEGDEDFVVTIAPDPEVDPGSGTILGITFNPMAIGERNATIKVLSNDLGTPIYSFAVKGMGTAPVLHMGDIDLLPVEENEWASDEVANVQYTLSRRPGELRDVVLSLLFHGTVLLTWHLAGSGWDGVQVPLSPGSKEFEPWLAGLPQSNELT